MCENKMKGFTLVELLAVIVIIGLIIIIALPKVLNTLNNSKKRTFELTSMSIIKAAEEKHLENEAYGIEEEITCESVSNITSSDFSSCEIEFDSEGNASVTLVGIGRYKGLYICNGTKKDIKAQTEECSGDVGNVGIASGYIEDLLEQGNAVKKGLIQTSVEYNGVTYDAGIRYVGTMDEVKNKVYYNCDDTDINGLSYGEETYDYASSCEVWRIIGLFDTKTNESGNTEKRIKIINTASTFSASWDSSGSSINVGGGINEWGSGSYEGADLMRLLNGFYIGKEGTSCIYCDGDYQETCSQTCTADSLKNANMKVLTNTAKEMIDKAVWDTYAVKWPDDGVTDSSFASTAYLEEKGISNQYTGKICTSGNWCNDTVERTVSWTGLVGLMSVSDILYANGWLYNQPNSELNPWSITPLAFSDYSDGVWCAFDDHAPGNYADTKSGVFASVYLKHDIEIIGGDGYTVPYKLKI